MMRARPLPVKPDGAAQRGFVVGFFFTTVDFLVVVVFFFVVGAECVATRVECFGRLWTTFLPAASDVEASAKIATSAMSRAFMDFPII
jgi:hypothetical protein